ncbi:patched domain-containing protein 3 [Aplysia californica]|uniref:Patched domain-containing protein 3 n=1 Tax=Aplysia californica TaxID=6500 RepID=A0ABM1A1D6_APLCA|nr:patched domain-containing protein 3 [Aplysia californica]
MQCVWNCQRTVLSGFYRYGHFVGSHPAPFLLLPLVICSSLALGFLNYDPESNSEVLYTPTNSRAVSDRALVEDAFPDLSDSNFDPTSTSRLPVQAVVIFRSRLDLAIFTDEVLNELLSFNSSIWDLVVFEDGQNYTYSDLCAVRAGRCAVGGEIFLSPDFRTMLDTGQVTYPLWLGTEPLDLEVYFSNVSVSQSGVLQAAGTYKMSFPLRTDTEKMSQLSLAWELKFVDFMATVDFNSVDWSYSASQSLDLELDKGTAGDVFLFTMTFALMITYASIVSSGGDCLSTRALLANGGVVASLLGTLGALGLVTLIGVRYVNIVGVMPFLTLGIGVDDMFLLMNSWSETAAQTTLSVPQRIGMVFRKAGVGISITSLTDFLSFVVGSTSVFKSVSNFCIYAGVGVLLCYVCNATLFGACLTYHGRRVYSSRHAVTCRPVTKSRAELRGEGHNLCYVYMCGGSVPRSHGDDQSPCERGPRSALKRLVLWNPMRVLILIVFSGYLAVAIWGVTELKQGLELKNIVPLTSYVHKYQVWNNEDFGVKLPVSFVQLSPKDHRGASSIQSTQELLTKAKQDSQINPVVEKCWLTSYALSPSFNTSTDELFFLGLEQFLRENPRFYSDVVLEPQNFSVTASRCFVYSYKIVDSNEQAALMSRMREVADSSPLGVFAFQPAFVYFEQYLAVLPSTLKTVGATIAVMFVVTCLFLPHPIIVTVVMGQVLMIVIGVFGYMSIWGLSLSSITMIQIIMSVGFSVDFCAHVCTAYMISDSPTRRGRATEAMIDASGPILNGGISSIIGLIALLFTESYIFQSFFKIMFLVIGFGTAHAVLLIPVVLSFIGPEARPRIRDEYANNDDAIPSDDNVKANDDDDGVEEGFHPSNDKNISLSGSESPKSNDNIKLSENESPKKKENEGGQYETTENL